MKLPRLLLLPTFALSCSLPALIPSAQAQSLWISEANSEQSMTADSRARNVGDILTIVVDESTTSTLAQELKTYDGAQGGAGVWVNGLIDEFVKLIPRFAEQSFNIPDASEVTIPTLDVATQSQFTGGGETTNRMTVSNRTAVTVVDVLPNGNLVVEGAKIVRLNKENQYVYMRGVVRQKDVTRFNTVRSSEVADAQVEFIPEGELTEAERKGWLLRGWDRIKPF